MNQTNIVHLKTGRSWWSGRITALCGATAEQGTYKEVGPWSSSKPRCPACQRIKRGGR